MQSKEKNSDSITPMSKAKTSTYVVTADAVQAEEVPTIPLGSLQTISSLQPAISVRSVASTRAVSVPAPLVVQASEYRRSFSEWFQVWWDGLRPAYLPLSLLPALLGTVLAWTQSITTKTPFGQFHLSHFVFTLGALILLQVGAHLVNDYYDYLRGVDTGNAFGPGGLIQQGLIKPTQVLTYGLSLLGTGVVLGSIVAVRGGFIVFLLGIIGLGCGYFYSATSRSLSSLVLGEFVTLWVFGPVITLGTYMVQTGGYASFSTFIYGLPLGLLAVAVVHVNNMRDVEGDAQAGKRTIATLFGLQWSRAFLLILLVCTYGFVTFLALPHGAPHFLLLTLWTLPLLVIIVTGALRTDTPAGLHLVMRQLLRLEIYFMLLLVAALILTAIIPVLPHIPSHLLPF